MVNRSLTPRTDLPYLRRRIKPGRDAAASGSSSPAAAVPPPNAPTPARQPLHDPAGLNLSRPLAAAAPAPATREPAAVSQPSGLVLGGHRAAPAAPVAPTQPPRRPAGPTLGGKAPASTANPRARRLAALREAAKVADHEVQLLFAAPGIDDVYELNLQSRVLRLTALESSVGTMVVSGSTAMAWESVRRVVGGADAAGHTAGTPVTTSGNRPLVGYDGRNALVSLRHVRELRRAIFINRSRQAMGVQLFSGATVALPPAADGTQMVLLLHRIGNVLELRAEPVPTSWEDVQIWQEFDFTMTHRAPVAAYGR